MKWSAAAVGLAVSVAAQDVLKPDSPPPAGCSTSHDGRFQVSVYSLGQSKRDLQKRSCDDENILTMTLKDGVLKDAKGRIGSIVANYQFQFDGPPPQAGAIYTGGWSVCNNGSLALGGSTVFYRCLSGDFYNLYDRHWAAQCDPIDIVAFSCEAARPATTPASVGQIPDGQAQGAPGPAPPVAQIADGQIQQQPKTASAPPPVAQIPDGQVQQQPKPASSPVAQIPDGQVQQQPKPASSPVAQIPDGQVQQQPKPASSPVAQIPDGQVQQQPQAASPVKQIGDGQVQAATGNVTAPAATPVRQIGDGQVQAPVHTAAAEKLFPGLAAAAAVAFGALL